MGLEGGCAVSGHGEDRKCLFSESGADLKKIWQQLSQYY